MDPILVWAIVLVAVVAAIAMVRRDITSFRERFPPISDAEFLARCRPGTNPEVALKVRRIVAKHFGIEYERVYPSMTFIEDIGAD
jgi:hypothetical protein